ncbi:hypothetical protein ZHAS_00002652 [Anopheles sinensis]|uniref:Uncharacterized protein n=1 Tax=Anopheles sinensis TaxID=74873 RepID=A0A084VCQ6_ANOSI|nr:hypothetical protein ZHAS_00002652 [Anopheles sinensis]
MKFVLVAATVLLALGSSQADYPMKGYGKPAAHHGGHHGGHVPCGANLLFSCHPNVAHVPCVPAHGHEGGGYHHAAPAHHAPAPAYHAPAHHAPAPAYHAPAHHAPAPAYHAPAHHAPAPAKY